MDLHAARHSFIADGLAILPPSMSTKKALVMMLAIGLQESRFKHRRQINGPARGFWQFERGGGVSGVLRHEASRKHALGVCDIRDVSPVPSKVYARLEHDDVLAAAFARLLLWTDPQPLPEIGDVQGAWDLYLRVWRPGKPHPETWAEFYSRALDEVEE